MPQNIDQILEFIEALESDTELEQLFHDLDL